MSTKVNGFFVNEIEPSAVIAGCVNIYENIWPEDSFKTINDIEQSCSTADSEIYWQRASTIGGGVFQDARTNKLLAVTHLASHTNNKIVKGVHNMFYNILISTLPRYQSMYGITDTLFEEDFNLLKYSDNQKYDAHYDGATDIGRAISAICYLNSDYIGGELEFVNFKIKIKPEPGMLILFPSNYAYRHLAHPVEKGTKYAMVTWIKDRKL